MKKREYDVVVVGAGPSGSMTAKFMAQKGYDVLLIEKRPIIGSPVRCGEATTSRKRLADFIDVVDDFIETDLMGITLFGQGGHKVSKDWPYVGVMLDRLKFDPYLAAQAEKAGAEVITSARCCDVKLPHNGTRNIVIEYQNEKFDVSAKIIVAADGVESLVGRWAGLKTRALPPKTCTAIDLHVEGILGPDEAKGHLVFWHGHDYINDGYIWSFPKLKSQTTNFGLGFLMPKLGAPNPLELSYQWLEKLYPGSKVNGVVGGAVPVGGTLEEYVADHFLMVGDAASHTNPLTGGGIIAGMYSGVIAAEHMDAAFKAGDFSKVFLEQYQKDCWNRFASNHAQEKEVRDYVLQMTAEEQDRFYGLVAEYMDKGMLSTLIKNPRLSWKYFRDFKRMLKGRF